MSTGAASGRSSEPRRLRPLLFVAYGEGGGEWLRAVAAACARQPLLEPLAAARVLQFWWIGGHPPGLHPEALASVPPTVDAGRLRRLLDTGRSARNRAALPGLELHTALVIERWSLFDEAAAHRIALRAALDAARRVDCQPERDPEFDLDWLSLVDCTRPSVRPDDATLARVRRMLRPDALPDRALLIDRADAGGATVDREMADRCFLALALALAASEHAFPRAGAADAGRSLALSAEAEPGTAMPVALLVLDHGAAGLERAIAERRRRQLLAVPAAGRPAAAATAAQAFADLPGREAAELDTGTYAPREARLRRVAAAEALLRAAFLERDGALVALAAIDRARAAARAGLDAGPADARDAANAKDAAHGSKTTSPRNPPVILPPDAQPATGLHALWDRLLVRRRAAPRARAASPEDQDRGPDAARAAAARQWGELCAALATVLGLWRDAELATQRGAAAPAGHVWERVEGSPWDWRLVRDPAPHAAAAPDPGAGAALAGHCLRLALDGAPPGTLLDAATREVARRDLAGSPAVAAELLRAALDDPHAAPLRDAIRGSALLANAGRRVGIAEVLWVTAARPGIADALAALEPVDTRARVRVLTHDDAGRSIRIALGEPIRWAELLSLSFLRGA